MEINVLHSSIFDSPAQVITNPVNTVGVMGAGLAKAFKLRFPTLDRAYRKMCYNGKLQTGRPILARNTNGGPDILLFPTKQDWRNPSRYEYIELGCAYIAEHYSKWNITSIAFPALGCGLGGLNWNEVRKIIEAELAETHLSIYYHLPRK